MNMKHVLLFSLAVAGCISCGSKKEMPTYANPVIDMSLPDPTIICTDDGTFYLYATEDTRNVPIYSSANLIDWKFVGTAFTDSTRPDFEPRGGIWAPDINLIAGKYVLYYSMSEWGGEWTCGIGAAIADHPEGPFTDCGKLFRSNEIGVQNSIDPFYIEENGENFSSPAAEQLYLHLRCFQQSEQKAVSRTAEMLSAGAGKDVVQLLQFLRLRSEQKYSAAVPAEHPVL